MDPRLLFFMQERQLLLTHLYRREQTCELAPCCSISLNVPSRILHPSHILPSPHVLGKVLSSKPIPKPLCQSSHILCTNVRRSTTRGSLGPPLPEAACALCTC